MIPSNAIGIDYTDQCLRILVEEYIVQQHSAFTLQGVCNYVLYWALEEGKVSHLGNGLFYGNQICQTDCERISCVLKKIAKEGRIITLMGNLKGNNN